MATRRPRIVIKPNIKPAAPKPASAAPAKPKTPLGNSGFSESPSPATRALSVPPTPEECPQKNLDEEVVDKTLPEADAEADKRKALQALPGNESDKTPQQVLSKTEADKLNTRQTLPEADNHNTCQTLCKSEEHQSAVTVQDDVFVVVGGNLCRNEDTLVVFSEPIGESEDQEGLRQTNQQTIVLDLAQQDGSADAVPGTGTSGQAQVLKPRVVGKSEAPDKVDGDDSEVDSCCASEALSLEADAERQEEVGEKTRKKPRQRKPKKERTEPLPSREKSPDRQKMKMSDLLAWNPQQNFFPKKSKKKAPVKCDSGISSPAASPTAEDEKESTNESSSLPAPQIMIGPDGSIVLNAESLIVNTQKEDVKPREVIEDDDDDRYLNTNSYRKYTRAKFWTEEETDMFFVGLSMCGTDFSLLSNLLTNRSRRELKNKFYREERRNRDLIDRALSNTQQYDLTPFQKRAEEEQKKKQDKKPKPIKKEKTAKKATNRKKRKRKNKDSEGEESNLDAEFDGMEEVEDNEDTMKLTVVPAGKRTKMSAIKKEDNPGDQIHEFYSLDDEVEVFVPAHAKPMVGTIHSPASRDVLVEYPDLENPQTPWQSSKGSTSRPTAATGTGPPFLASAPSPASSQNPGSDVGINSIMRCIPGATMVQIEMEGTQNPVQAVVIPSHLVPQIAPQLGIPGNGVGMQVLLVQEETSSGGLVHVYVVPDPSYTAGIASGGGEPGPASLQQLHAPQTNFGPTRSPMCIVPTSPMPKSPHPLASVCSPLPPNS